jgi:hypothetical protein
VRKGSNGSRGILISCLSKLAKPCRSDLDEGELGSNKESREEHE